MKKTRIPGHTSQLAAEAFAGTAVEMAWADSDIGVGTQKIRPPNDSAQPGVVTGVLIGFRDQGRTPLVMFPGQIGTAAVPARAVAAATAAGMHGPIQIHSPTMAGPSIFLMMIYHSR